MTMYIVWITLTDTVYAMGGGGGWTKFIDRYAYAADEEAATDLAERWCAAQGLSIAWCKATQAIQQDRTRYTFPENILTA